MDPVKAHDVKVQKRYDARDSVYWMTVCSCGWEANGVADIGSLQHVLQAAGLATFDPQLLTGVQYKTMDRALHDSTPL